MRNAGNYELKTGDVEGAEQIRGMSGWKKYGYMKARAGHCWSGFGQYMTDNSGNEQFSVNGYTLASAPDAATDKPLLLKWRQPTCVPIKG